MAPRDDAATTSARPALSRYHSTSKASLMSPSPSLEGDDEYSSGEEHEHAMEYVQDEPKYLEEDTRPTSTKELAGWYSYGWAAEVFVVCAMGSFLPITLEQLARDRGVLLHDKSRACVASWKTESPNNTTVDAFVRPPPEALEACVVYILGIEINTASFAMYTFSLSVLIQSLLIVSMSGAADHGRFRKTFLLAFAGIGSIATMLFLPVTPKVYLIGALLAVVANTCFGASFVLLNSFLPLMVRYHPTIQTARLQHEAHANRDHSPGHASQPGFEHEHNLIEATSSLLPSHEPDRSWQPKSSSDAVSPELRLSTQLSSYGVSVGYAGALLVQISSILVVSATGSTTFSLRLVLSIVGAWWLLFSIPAALWLRPRPGPPLPAAFSTNAGWTSYVTYAWKSLFRTLGRARKLKDIIIFLCAWFLLSDSIATVSGTAILFAKTNLNMKVEALVLINIITTVAGVIGALYWSTFSRYFNLRASQTIMACICLFELIPLYGLLGFLPSVQRLGWLGLQQPVEMYILGAVYGLTLGGLSSYCRSFFGELIPPGFEAAFYALYAITDKGSSIFGPAIVGLITDYYGDIRPSFAFLAVLVALPLPLMMLVNVDRGKADAASLALELEGVANNPSSGAGYGSIPQLRLPDEDEDQD